MWVSHGTPTNGSRAAWWGHRFDYETEVLIIASRKGYRIESVPITTVYSDQVSKIHPLARRVSLSQIDVAV